MFCHFNINQFHHVILIFRLVEVNLNGGDLKKVVNVIIFKLRNTELEHKLELRLCSSLISRIFK